MNTIRLEDELGEILIPRDKAASQLIGHLKSEKSLPLISIYGPSGVGKTDLAGKILAQQLKSASGKLPKLLRVPISADDAAIDVALRVTDLIIENHSEFRSRKAAKVFRDKMTRSVRRSPAEAAERLRSMMRASEKGKFELKKIQLLICLDGVDKLFESRARCGADLSKAAICGEADDPVGFLSKLVGMNSILFSMVHRSWVSRDVRTILDRGGLDKDRRFEVLLSYPDSEEVETIVQKVLAPIRSNTSKKDQIDEYSDLLTDSLRKNPALIGVLPTAVTKMFGDHEGNLTRIEGCVDRHLENNGLLGDLVKKADEIYLQQNSNNKLALEEVFSNLIKGKGRLLIKDAVMSEELWAIALNFVDNRILAIDGRNYRNARFITTHRGLLETWTRAVNWTGEKRSIGITQLRSLDDKALSWQLADRNRALLLDTEESKESARLVLNDSELSSQLSPLTREFLVKSLKPKKDLKKVMLSKKLWIPVGSFFGLLFLLAVVVVVIPDPADKQIAQTNQPAKVEPVVAKVEENIEVVPAEHMEIEAITPDFVPKSFLEDIKIEPVTEELLASAGVISKATDAISEEVPLLPEADLIPAEIDPSYLAEEVFVAPAYKEPLLSELELIAHVEKVNSGYSAMPLGLPSAQAHYEKGLRRIKDANTVSNTSSWRSLLNHMGAAIATEDLDSVLDALRHFHEKTVLYPDQIKDIKVGEFKDLTSHLGKVALVQQDKIAMQGAWKLELASQKVVELDHNLRMLMARVALNAGREQEAVAYVAKTEVQTEVNPMTVDILKATLGWQIESNQASAH